MNILLRRLGAVLLPSGLALLIAFGSSGPALAQTFDVPDGFHVGKGDDFPPDGKWRPILTVRPDPGPFSDLSAIRLGQVAGAVGNPKAWLQRRVTLDLGQTGNTGSVFDSPDSPFSDPLFDALRKAVPELMKMAEQVARLPLESCDAPGKGYNATGAYDELYCVFTVGPIRQYLVLRLQEAQGHWYYTEVTTMNERRLRHLLAIADTFKTGG
ncbi:MAG: hypothetical protein IID53_00475 [Proteobacteria bacterium]|nr:hypothetical protein [Pseudomonadota bacterium]